jgi:hypothetical protein
MRQPNLGLFIRSRRTTIDAWNFGPATHNPRDE